MQFSLDTKSKLGVIKTSRPVVVIGPEYMESFRACYEAQQHNDQQELAEARTKLLSTVYKDEVKPGAKCALSGEAKCNLGSYPGGSKLAANVKWFVHSDFLRVRADVTDRFFAPAAADESPEDGSSLQLFICPGGITYDINAITIVPAGAGGKAKVTFKCGQYGPTIAEKEDCAKRAKAVTATWKRTAEGYSIDAKIPWSVVKGYYAGWKQMPVNAAVNTSAPDGRCQIIMNKPGDPMTEPFIYPVLR